MKASQLFNALMGRFLDEDTHLDLLMRTGHYAEPESADTPKVVPPPVEFEDVPF